MQMHSLLCTHIITVSPLDLAVQPARARRVSVRRPLPSTHRRRESVQLGSCLTTYGLIPPDAHVCSSYRADLTLTRRTRGQSNRQSSEVDLTPPGVDSCIETCGPVAPDAPDEMRGLYIHTYTHAYISPTTPWRIEHACQATGASGIPRTDILPGIRGKRRPEFLVWFTTRFAQELCAQPRDHNKLGVQCRAAGVGVVEWYQVHHGASSQGNFWFKKEKRRHATSRMTDSIRRKSKEMGYFRLVNSDSGRCDPGLAFIHCLPAGGARQ